MHCLKEGMQAGLRGLLDLVPVSCCSALLLSKNPALSLEETLWLDFQLLIQERQAASCSSDIEAPEIAI